MSNGLTVPALLALLGAMGIAAALLARVLRARRRRRQRTVEAPNSHHTWERVRARETHDRWRGIALDRIHPVNRGEVQRLLDRLQASGPDVLREQERRFLDQMAEIAGVPPLPGPPAAGDRALRGPPGNPDLRHRTT